MKLSPRIRSRFLRDGDVPTYVRDSDKVGKIAHTGQGYQRLGAEEGEGEEEAVRKIAKNLRNGYLVRILHLVFLHLPARLSISNRLCTIVIRKIS